MIMLPSWQIVLAIAAATFMIRHKGGILREFLLLFFGEGLADCSFCIGAHLGWVSYFAMPGASAGVGGHVASCLVWVGCSAAASICLDSWVDRESP